MSEQVTTPGLAFLIFVAEVAPMLMRASEHPRDFQTQSRLVMPDLIDRLEVYVRSLRALLDGGHSSDDFYLNLDWLNSQLGGPFTPAQRDEIVRLKRFRNVIRHRGGVVDDRLARHYPVQSGDEVDMASPESRNGNLR